VVTKKKQQAQVVPEKQQAARREKAAYVAPAIMTLAVAPSHAKAPSDKSKLPKT
jgi:hypothetical protein